MKVNLFSTMLLAASLTAYAAEGGPQAGQVWLQGTVLDSSCTISMQSQYQRIEIPQVAATGLYQHGYSSAFVFAVRLENCLLSEDGKNVRITFTGPVNSNGLFAVSGGAQGAGIQLSREDGTVISPGKAVVLRDIPQTENITLNYRLRLIADRRLLKTGEYQSTINFNLDYL